MVAVDSRDTPDSPRGLSAEAVAQLRDAIASRRKAAREADAPLVTALHNASAEAKARGLRPEELIVILKRLAADVAREERGTFALEEEEHARLVAWLVTSSLKAYFGA